MSKHQIQPVCGEWAGWRGTGRSNPSLEAKFSGANGDSELLILPSRAVFIGFLSQVQILLAIRRRLSSILRSGRELD